MTVPSDRQRGDGALGAALGFVAGFVDALGFIALFGLFAAHVTGNFATLGADLTGDGGPVGLLAKLLALPVFILAAGLAAALARAAQRRNRSAGRPLIGVQILLLAAFTALGAAQGQPVRPDSLLTLFTGFAGVAAMAVQNVAGRIAFTRLATTTVMTSNVTEMSIDLADLLSRDRARRAAGAASLRKFGPPLLAFGIGAVCGALGYQAFGFAAMAAPLAVLAGLRALLPKTAD